MKLYLSTLALTLILAYLAYTTITWRPFSISFGRGWLVLGIVSIMCGCIYLKYHWYNEGLKKGAEIKKEVMEEVKEEFKQDKIKRSL